MIAAQLRTSLLLLLAALLTGCTFSRIRINEEYANLDLDKIEIGQTTYREVLREFGPPGPISVEKDAVNNISQHHLRYSVVDIRTVDFFLAYWLILPFTWNTNLAESDTLIEFDEDGKVSHVTRVERKNIWRPMKKIESLQPASVTFK